MDSIFSLNAAMGRVVPCSFRRSKRSRQPSVLLLTSNLGAGHARAAMAIQRSLWQQAPECQIETVDFWSLMDPGVSEAVQRCYLRLVSDQPDLYQRIYELDQHAWRMLLERGKSPAPLLHPLNNLVSVPKGVPADFKHWFDRVLFKQLTAILATGETAGESLLQGVWKQQAVAASWRLLASRLLRRIRRFNPDVIVATQVNMGALAANLKCNRLINAHLTGVLTDFGVHDFWSQRHMDSYCIADTLRQPAATQQFPAHARVEVTGMPLMPEFSALPAAHEARRKLGIAADRSVVLVLGGGLGLCMADAVRLLAARFASRPKAAVLLVLTGTNTGFEAELKKDPVSAAALVAGNIQVHGWTEHVSTYMRAADVVVGKPGGLTTAEVLACGRPLYSTRCLGGQEAFNVSYLEHNGVGALLTEAQMGNAICTLLDDQEALQRLQARAWTTGRRDGARVIAARTLAFASAHQFATAGNCSHSP